MNKLTIQEGLELEKLEAIIERHREGALMLWAAATKIRDAKLYRAKFKTWEEYCKTRWGWSMSHVNHGITGLRNVKQLPPAVATMVATERAARALATVPKEDRVEAVKTAAAKGKDGKATGKAIAEAAKAIKAAKETVELDSTGYPIPKALLALWARSDEINALLNQLTKVKSELVKAQNDKDALFAEINFSTAVGDIEKAYTAIKATKPYAVCMRCQGHPDTQWGGCRLCFGRGVIGEFRYKTVPEEERKMREKGKK